MGAYGLPPVKKAIAAVTPLAAALAPIAACGGDEEADGGDDRSGATSEARETVEVTTNDLSFSPSKLTARVGDPFDVVLTNASNAPHTFTIDEFEVDAEVAAGEEKTLSVTPSESGEFSYYCRFHRQQGMQGSITVSGVGGAGDTDPTESPADGGYYDY
jgi:plastocyanin